jgi:cell division protein FtsB
MKSRHKKSKIWKILVKQGQILLVIILVVVIFSILRVIYFRVQDERIINKGVEALQFELVKFDQENKDLNKLVRYFNSTEFQEKEIKGKLNLVKEGEKIVFIQSARESGDGMDLDSEQESINVITVRTNYYYWWKYFFGR